MLLSRSILRRCYHCLPLLRRTHSMNIESHGQLFEKDDIPPKAKLFPISKYGGETVITLVTGQTVMGKQGAHFIKQLFESARVPLSIEHIVLKSNRKNKGVSKEYLMSVTRNRCAIYIDEQHDLSEKEKSMNLISVLNLYANVARVHSIKGFKCRYPKANILLISATNSGDYRKLEYEPVKGIVKTMRICDRENIERFLNFAFQYAIREERKKITFAHKMRDLPLADGFFIELATKLHREKYSQICMETKLIDQLVSNLIMKPDKFDVICSGDMYGTFLQSIAGSVCGGVGLFTSVEMGDTHAIFKPMQTKLSITNIRQLCPYGIVRTIIELLYHLKLDKCAETMEMQLNETMNKIKTKEFGGSARENYVICHIGNHLKRCTFVP